jgi:hypothetical protein
LRQPTELSGAPEIAVAPRRQRALDRDRVRAAVRTLPTEYVRYMLIDAIDLLPPAKLYAVAQKYLDLRALRLDRKKTKKASLLADVKAFEKASLVGELYDSFDVNSKNFMEQSRGTTHWIAECRRVLDRSVTHAQMEEPATVCQAFGIIFGLLDRLDQGRDEVVFFADEAGAWQVGIDWRTVLPAWFKVLSATAQPEEYGQRIARVLERHYSHGSAKMLGMARKIATPAQRAALGRLQTERGLPAFLGLAEESEPSGPGGNGGAAGRAGTSSAALLPNAHLSHIRRRLHSSADAITLMASVGTRFFSLRR